MARLLQVEKAHQAMTQALMAGNWKPGETLNLRSLAEEIGVSVTPVREAINELVAQGVLERRPGVGISVVRPTLDELADFYRFRGLVEGFAARLLAERASPVILFTLTAEAEALDELRLGFYERASEGEGVSEREELRRSVDEREAQFHRSLVEQGGSVYLSAAWQRCFCLLRMVWAWTTPGTLSNRPEAPADHRRLVEAICSGDPEQAEKIGREHGLEHREILLEAYQELISGEADHEWRGELQRVK